MEFFGQSFNHFRNLSIISTWKISDIPEPNGLRWGEGRLHDVKITLKTERWWLLSPYECIKKKKKKKNDSVYHILYFAT